MEYILDTDSQTMTEVRAMSAKFCVPHCRVLAVSRGWVNTGTTAGITCPGKNNVGTVQCDWITVERTKFVRKK